MKSGVAGAAVDKAARKVIEREGFGKYFGHGLGHGIGIFVHVGPYMGPKSKDILRRGMVVTVEPGIYIPEEGIGVRIEDDLLITGDGCRVLSERIPKTVEEIEQAMAE